MRALFKKSRERLLIPPIARRTTAKLLEDALSREELIEFCQENGGIYHYDVVSIPNADSAKPDCYVTEPGIDSSTPTTCVVPNAKIISSKGVTLTSDGRALLESVKGSTTYLNSAMESVPFPVYARSLLPEWISGGLKRHSPSRHYSMAVSMITHTLREHHYGHWLVEYLPILYHLSKFEEKTGYQPLVFVNRDPPSWMVDSLEFFGITQDRIIEWDGNTIGVDHLLVPLQSTTGNLAEEIKFNLTEFRWLNHRFQMSTWEGSSKRIYVSRQGLDRRKVLNFGALRNLLTEFDFEIVRPETQTFNEQVRTFSEADIIVGGYGSGLHNMLFTSNAKIVELFPPGYESDLNRLLARVLGHEYRSLSGLREGCSRDVDSKNPKNQSYEVRPEKLRADIQQFI